MKRILGYGLAIVMMLSGTAAAEELTGRRIMELQQVRHSARTDTGDVVMITVDKKGNSKQRLLTRYGKEMEDGLKRALVVFREPRDVAGTALLTWELGKGESKQWLYLPGQKKMQRIAGKSGKSYFMGTDFTYEDLRPDEIEGYAYKMLPAQPFDGVECHVIEVTPETEAKKRESAYSKRVIWVRKDIFFTVRTDFYDRRGRKIKTLTNHELAPLEGDAWMAKKSLMVNHRNGHKTVMGIKNRRINVPIEDALFTERFILSGRHLR